jgi:hypothetical protein
VRSWYDISRKDVLAEKVLTSGKRCSADEGGEGEREKMVEGE